MSGQNNALQSFAGSMLQMMFNGGGVAPTKSDSLDADGGSYQTSPWANIISVGKWLKKKNYHII